jgi:hypothetical protein
MEPMLSPAVMPLRMEPVMPTSPWLPALRYVAWTGLLLGATPLLLYLQVLRSGPAIAVSLALLLSVWPLLLALLSGLLLTLPLLVASVMAQCGKLGRRPALPWLVLDLLPAVAALLIGLLLVWLVQLWR